MEKDRGGERERGRERHRETERQRDRETERQMFERMKESRERNMFNR
jgi:hypothetical protein